MCPLVIPIVLVTGITRVDKAKGVTVIGTHRQVDKVVEDHLIGKFLLQLTLHQKEMRGVKEDTTLRDELKHRIQWKSHPMKEMPRKEPSHEEKRRNTSTKYRLRNTPHPKDRSRTKMTTQGTPYQNCHERRKRR